MWSKKNAESYLKYLLTVSYREILNCDHESFIGNKWQKFHEASQDTVVLRNDLRKINAYNTLT